MTGGTGFVGTQLTRSLTEKGFEVTILTRSIRQGQPARDGALYVEGDPTATGTWQDKVAEHDVVINLAGTSIFTRWNRKTKEQMRNSRILTTRNVVEALSGRQGKKTTLLSTSAIGYYGFCGEEALREDSPPGGDFLASLAQDWEAAAMEAEQFGVRVVCCRFGIVMGRRGGALAEMVPLFRKGLGSPLGSGHQWVSWVHEKELADIHLFLIENERITGAVNCTAPNPVTNRKLTSVLAEVLGKPAFLPAVPGFVLKLKMGEFGNVLLKGQKVLPAQLLNNGYQFRFGTLKEALKDLLS
jgi:uncharacterized protein (TIGR01777 family)